MAINILSKHAEHGRVEFVRHLAKRGYAGSPILVSGEDEHLRKPVKPEMLAALLEKWVPAVAAEHWSQLELSKTAKLANERKRILAL